MKCPIDDTVLQMTDRHGIEIDYCPTCRGVWLDRGELDKVIEVATREARGQAPLHAPQASSRREESRSWDDGRHPRRDDDDGDDDRDGGNRRRPNKRRSLLGELFEFGE